jgi:hypothetical protein
LFRRYRFKSLPGNKHIAVLHKENGVCTMQVQRRMVTHLRPIKDKQPPTYTGIPACVAGCVAGHSTKTKCGIRFKLIKAIANIRHPHAIRDAIGVITHTLSFEHEKIYKLSGI